MIRDLVYQWNDTHSPLSGVVLLPVMWETHAVPQMGDRPQGIINKQIVANTDLLVGVFWTRLGTHTGRAESGTVEEIEEFRRQGKPVLLYFSSAPVVPDSIDMEQYQKLKEYKESLRDQGLMWEYSEVDEFRSQVDRHLVGTVNRFIEVTADSPGEVQTEPASAETPDEARDLRLVLRGLVDATRIRWESERDSEPVSVEGGKSLLMNLGESLVEFLVASQDQLDEPTIRRIRHAIVETRELQRHMLFLDGGKSYREFWEKGNALIEDLTNLVRS